MALVIFLRGVNVGGHRTFRPSLLAKELEKFGVVNIGAAGTFVISKPISQKQLRQELQQRLPFETEVMITTCRALMAAAAENPFGAAPSDPKIVRFVSVLAKSPRQAPFTPLCIPKEGRWLLKILSIHGRFLFGIYRREMKAIGCIAGIDRLLGVRATTRNWNTISTILKSCDRNG